MYLPIILGLPSGCFQRNVPTKIPCTVLVSPVYLHAQPIVASYISVS